MLLLFITICFTATIFVMLFLSAALYTTLANYTKIINIKLWMVIKRYLPKYSFSGYFYLDVFAQILVFNYNGVSNIFNFYFHCIFLKLNNSYLQHKQLNYVNFLIKNIKFINFWKWSPFFSIVDINLVITVIQSILL